MAKKADKPENNVSACMHRELGADMCDVVILLLFNGASNIPDSVDTFIGYAGGVARSIDLVVGGQTHNVAEDLVFDDIVSSPRRGLIHGALMFPPSSTFSGPLAD